MCLYFRFHSELITIWVVRINGPILCCASRKREILKCLAVNSHAANLHNQSSILWQLIKMKRSKPTNNGKWFRSLFSIWYVQSTLNWMQKMSPISFSWTLYAPFTRRVKNNAWDFCVSSNWISWELKLFLNNGFYVCPQKNSISQPFLVVLTKKDQKNYRVIKLSNIIFIFHNLFLEIKDHMKRAKVKKTGKNNSEVKLREWTKWQRIFSLPESTKISIQRLIKIIFWL